MTKKYILTIISFALLLLIVGNTAIIAENETSALEDQLQDCSLYVPNAFTPGNGDPANDLFELKSNCAHTEYLLQIFDRYGKQVFISKDIKNSWDGTYEGNNLKSGVYVWQAKVSLERPDGDITVVRKKGTVVLIR